MLIQTGRRRVFRITTALAVGWYLFDSETSVAGPAFVNVAASTNLNFVDSYGTTFEFDFLPWRKALMQRNMGNGAAVGDYDNDGDLDVYLLAQMDLPNKLFRNDLGTGGGFTDVTAFAGVGDLGFSRVAHFVDLDNDGFLDLLLVNDNDGSGQCPGSKIFRNNGDGTFDDVTAGSNFETEPGMLRCGVAVADYNQDGLLDVYVTNWSYRASADLALFPGMNRLYMNLGGFQFADVTAAAGLGVLDNDSYTAIFTDFNNDAFPDLYVAVDNASDEFYQNIGGTFANMTVEVGMTHVGNDMGAACADFDDDDDLDVYTTNITSFDGFGFDLYNVLYMQDFATGTFTDEASVRGVRNTYWGWGVEFVDIDNDGDLDIVAVTGFQEFLYEFNGEGTDVWDTPNVFFLNDGTGHYTRIYPTGSAFTDDARALVAFDYDRDGDQDLLTTNIEEPVRLLENISSPQGNWLDLALVQGAGANRNAIGARAYATFDSKTIRRDIICGESYLAGNPAEIHFGLGEAESADLRIRWTDGSENIFEHVAANQFIKISNVPGDCTADALLDIDDIAGFVAALIGSPNASPCLTDTNGDGSSNGEDIQTLVQQLVDGE